MFYGVEESTDMRDSRIKINKFKTESALKKWMKNSGGLTYKDPEGAGNYHHTFRSGYEYIGRIDKKDRIFKLQGTPTYPMTLDKQKVIYLEKYATKIT